MSKESRIVFYVGAGTCGLAAGAGGDSQTASD